MTDQDSLRDRIDRAVDKALVDEWNTYGGCGLSDSQYVAQAIIDELGLTVHGDDCGYHEIHGSYDTRFEEH